MEIYSVAEAAARIELLSQRKDGAPFLLGVVGPPGAGKSTFAEMLAVPILPMDGFHFANEHLDRLGLRNKKGAPETFDAAGFAATLRRLRAGEAVVAPRFDRELDAAIAGAVLLPGDAPLIVTEGNYLLHDNAGWGAIRPLLDEVWYLDINDDLRRDRLVARHERYGRSEADAARWVAEVDEPNAVLIRTTRQRADAVIAAA
ncbi:nucleoside/nucleotide kinase family protein [Salinibacterium sp. NG253]|uniref:nucleoside/nucleotide kinase family protein n=1 Tax=Salinibacterium sp. NG253 TaxID=2792039 RepID=UPI0018CF480E|nr:nucleoside/nucleotide kinase family protein [Salinibacterium sp. NG253]MBH0117113.1 nucleoside/nucleotide kinase family protein [Salinibacterium sp. NG253]